MTADPAPSLAALEPAPVDRRLSLGASDAAAVVGLDPWRTPYDVWLEKTGRIGPILTPSAAMEAGTYIEPALLEWAGARLDDPIVARQVRVRHPIAHELTATLDGVTASGALVEAKTAGLVGGGGPHLDAWGDAGTDTVPVHVLIQVQHQLAVVRAQTFDDRVAPPSVCHVPALLARRGLVLFHLEPHAPLGAALLAAEIRFWRKHVLTDIPPPDALPSLENLARMTRDAGVVAVIGEAPVRAWLEAKDAAAAAQQAEDDAKRALLAELNDAETGTCPLGTLTYRLSNRKAYTVAASSSRRLHWSANKSPIGA